MADLDGHWQTRTDIGRLGRTLADLDGQWRTWTDIADSDGHWQTRTDIGGLRRTRFAKGRPVFRDHKTKGNP